MKVTLDNGETWIDADSVQVIYAIPDTFSEHKDLDIELSFKFTAEGLTQDLWIEGVNQGKLVDTYNEIGENLASQ